YDASRPLVIDPDLVPDPGWGLTGPGELTFEGDGSGCFGTSAGWGIAVDPSWNSYVTGYVECLGQMNAFVMQVNPTGTAYTIACITGGGGFFTGPGQSAGYGIDVDNWGNSYVTGWIGTAAYTGPFVLKLDPSLTTILWKDLSTSTAPSFSLYGGIKL